VSQTLGHRITQFTINLAFALYCCSSGTEISDFQYGAEIRTPPRACATRKHISPKGKYTNTFGFGFAVAVAVAVAVAIAMTLSTARQVASLKYTS